MFTVEISLRFLTYMVYEFYRDSNSDFVGDSLVCMHGLSNSKKLRLASTIILTLSRPFEAWSRCLRVEAWSDQGTWWLILLIIGQPCLAATAK